MCSFYQLIEKNSEEDDMDVKSIIHDERINSNNLFVETTVREYLSFAQSILDNNELQRKRVKTSKTVYSLLKTDLKKGCVMPPIVLAMTNNLGEDISTITGHQLLSSIQSDLGNVLILDGLQRTFTLIDADSEMSCLDKNEYDRFLNNVIRLEIYININKFGILYRMLTLNTGQTPMSTRHQLEMLYSGLLNNEFDGVKLVTDRDGIADVEGNEFVFKNVIEGFNSFMNRNELPIDRQEMLENIKMLENMASENVNSDVFVEFLNLYVKVFNTFREVTEDHIITKDELNEYGISSNPFGLKASKIFSESQAFTGFGAAIGKMKDRGLLSSFDDVSEMLIRIKENNSGFDWMIEMLRYLDSIRNNSKKIGNAQRMYFAYFFRELFNRESDSFLNLNEAVSRGYHNYYSQVN